MNSIRHIDRLKRKVNNGDVNDKIKHENVISIFGCELEKGNPKHMIPDFVETLNAKFNR